MTAPVLVIAFEIAASLARARSVLSTQTQDPCAA